MIYYYTTDTGVLAPHPDMTHEQLNDYESWAGIKKTDKPSLDYLLAWTEVQQIAPN